MSELFRLDGMRVSYGKREIIHNVSLHIQAGEFCALLGLNGSGKTTILHAACGLIPMAGHCMIDAQDCTALHERKRAQLISFIPQTCGLSGGKTALEVVLMGFNARLGLLESPSAAQKAQALHALDKLGCAEFAQADFGALSQGQRQLVILARCIVQDTPVMLMDEPDSALDFLNRHMVLEKIQTLIKAENRAGLITLHDPNFAMAYCDRLLLLRDGALTAELDMRTVDAVEVREKLSLIYGAIELLPHKNSYLMGKA
ncbi:MAG: ABC transporter ATP-binding protein [Clostridia bacterium]|nr:ABC transporter ATP-binding protein [Clostridia bacterium]